MTTARSPADSPGSLKPLAGRRVVVTRAAHQASELLAGLEELGARVELLPLLEVVVLESSALERAFAELESFRWLAFTSANAVHSSIPRLKGRERLPATAAVGPATVAALRAHDIEPTLEAERRDGRGLAAALIAAGPERPSRILVPQADDARPDLVAGLRAAGFEVDAVTTYGKRLPVGTAERVAELFADQALGWVTFTSPRIVRHFVEQLEGLVGPAWPERREELRAASIGPTTSEALRRQGIEPRAEASPPGARELIAAIVSALR